MPHKPQNTQSLSKAFDHYRNSDHKAFRQKKKTHHYPFGRKTGCDNIITEAYRDGWDRIFGKKQEAEPADFDAAEPTTKGKRK